jgi:hypothetical protein
MAGRPRAANLTSEAFFSCKLMSDKGRYVASCESARDFADGVRLCGGLGDPLHAVAGPATLGRVAVALRRRIRLLGGPRRRPDAALINCIIRRWGRCRGASHGDGAARRGVRRPRSTPRPSPLPCVRRRGHSTSNPAGGRAVPRRRCMLLLVNARLGIPGPDSRRRAAVGYLLPVAAATPCRNPSQPLRFKGILGSSARWPIGFSIIPGRDTPSIDPFFALSFPG